MTNYTRNVVRLIAAPAIVACTAFGLAGLAEATTGPAAPTTTAPGPTGPGYEYYPDTYATPAPSQAPGWQNHHGPGHWN